MGLAARTLPDSHGGVVSSSDSLLLSVGPSSMVGMLAAAPPAMIMLPSGWHLMVVVGCVGGCTLGLLLQLDGIKILLI